MSPYRTAPAREPDRHPPSRLSRVWTRFRRRLVVSIGGSFKSRFPIRCDICGKPSRYEGAGDTLHIQSTYEPCGHEYYFWRRLRGETDACSDSP